MSNISAEGHTIVHNGGSEFAQFPVLPKSPTPSKGKPTSRMSCWTSSIRCIGSPVLDDEHRLHGNDGTAAGQVPTSDGPTCATPGAATAAWLLPYIPPRLHRLGPFDRRTPPARSVRKATRTKC